MKDDRLNAEAGEVTSLPLKIYLVDEGPLADKLTFSRRSGCTGATERMQVELNCFWASDHSS